MNRLYRAWLRFTVQCNIRGTERDLQAAIARDEEAMSNREWQSHMKYVAMLTEDRARLRDQLEAL